MGKKILVVEDERNIVDILTFNLQREGYDTLEALDGAAGLRLALEQDPDLILLDLMLPKLDGFQVCRTLREQGRATPIIMLTAREEETDKVLGLELGARPAIGAGRRAEPGDPDKKYRPFPQGAVPVDQGPAG